MQSDRKHAIQRRLDWEESARQRQKQAEENPELAALRAQVSAQAAEIERLKAELAESEVERKRQNLRAVGAEMDLKDTQEEIERLKDNLCEIAWQMGSSLASPHYGMYRALEEQGLLPPPKIAFKGRFKKAESLGGENAG